MPLLLRKILSNTAVFEFLLLSCRCLFLGIINVITSCYLDCFLDMFLPNHQTHDLVFTCHFRKASCKLRILIIVYFMSFCLFQTLTSGLLCFCVLWVFVDPRETVALKHSWVSLSFSGHRGGSSVCVYVCVSELSDPIISGRCSGAELQRGAEIYRLQPLKHEQTVFPQ